MGADNKQVEKMFLELLKSKYLDQRTKTNINLLTEIVHAAIEDKDWSAVLQAWQVVDGLSDENPGPAGEWATR